MVIVMEHFWLMEGACIETVFRRVGSVSLNFVSYDFHLSCNS